MDQKTLNKIIERITHRNMPPTLGYSINEPTFAIIAETAARNIYHWGWKRYVDYMNSWRLKVIIMDDPNEPTTPEQKESAVKFMDKMLKCRKTPPLKCLHMRLHEDDETGKITLI